MVHNDVLTALSALQSLRSGDAEVEVALTGKVRKGYSGRAEAAKENAQQRRENINETMYNRFNLGSLDPSLKLNISSLDPYTDVQNIKWKKTEVDSTNSLINDLSSPKTLKPTPKSAPKKQVKPEVKEVSNGKQKPRYWSKEDDENLRKAVEKCRENWSIVATYVPNRSYKDCYQRWTRVLAPGLKKGKWSENEDKMLLEVVNNYLKAVDSSGDKSINWKHVASKYEGRSAKQCRERWMNHLDPALKKSEWTVEEDFALLQLASSYPKKWARIARDIPGRTENMVKNRWHYLDRYQRWTTVLAPRVKKPDIKKGKWNVVEDKMLLSSIKNSMEGKCLDGTEIIDAKSINWKVVAKSHSGRSAKQCRERWMNHLDPQVKKTEWTPEEDSSLIELTKKHPKQWAKISREIPGRTEIMVKNRWYSLVRNSVVAN